MIGDTKLVDIQDAIKGVLTMQKQFVENLNKLSQCVSKPMADIVELNVNTLSNWSKNTGSFEELRQAKKPEDLLWTQMKLANIGQLEAASYVKKISDIWLNAIEQANEVYADMLHETTKASEAIKSGSKNK